MCEKIRALPLKIRNEPLAWCESRRRQSGKNCIPEIGSKKMEIGNKELRVEGNVLVVRYLNIKNRG